MKPYRTFEALAIGRDNNFDAIRLGLAILVIFSHSYPLSLKDGNRSEPLMRLTGGQRTLGEIAVAGFFLISGFLIAASWDRSRGTIDYFRRRALRIYPGFIAAVLFSYLIAAPLLVADASAYWMQFDITSFTLKTLNLKPNPHPMIWSNGSLWTIRYEFVCYVGIAFLGLLIGLRRRALVLAAMVVCMALHLAQLHFGLELPGRGGRISLVLCSTQNWPRLGACFLAGVSFYLYRDRLAISGRWALLAVLGLILTGLVPAAKALPILFPVLGGYLIFYLAAQPSPYGIARKLTQRGDLSYGLYLYAFPIQLLLVHSIGRQRLTPLTLFLAALLITSFFAILSWKLIESPCIRLKSRPARERANRGSQPAACETSPSLD